MPVRAEHLDDVVQLAGANDATCALTSVGEVFCWGLIAASNGGPPFVPLFGRYHVRPLAVAGLGGRTTGLARRIAMTDSSLAVISPSGQLGLAGDHFLLLTGDSGPPENVTAFVPASAGNAWLKAAPDLVFRAGSPSPSTLISRALVPTGVDDVSWLGSDGKAACWLGADRKRRCSVGRRSEVARPATERRVFIDDRAPHCIATEDTLACAPTNASIDKSFPEACFADPNGAPCTILALLSGRPKRIELSSNKAHGYWVLYEDGRLEGHAYRAPGPYLDIALSSESNLLCTSTPQGPVTCIEPGDDPAPPRAVSGTEGVSQLVGAGRHFCGLRPDGTVVCWGQNSGGQLGRGHLDRDDVGSESLDTHFVAEVVVAPALPQTSPQDASQVAHRTRRGIWLDPG